jgi:hypothetical protein
MSLSMVTYSGFATIADYAWRVDRLAGPMNGTSRARVFTSWENAQTEGTMRRILMLTGASLVILAGVALLVLPGPGIPLIAIGVVMLASEVPAVARWLNKMVERLPISVEKKRKFRSFVERRQRHAH